MSSTMGLDVGNKMSIKLFSKFLLTLPRWWQMFLFAQQATPPSFLFLSDRIKLYPPIFTFSFFTVLTNFVSFIPSTEIFGLVNKHLSCFNFGKMLFKLRFSKWRLLFLNTFHGGFFSRNVYSGTFQLEVVIEWSVFVFITW